MRLATIYALVAAIFVIFMGVEKYIYDLKEEEK